MKKLFILFIALISNQLIAQPSLQWAKGMGSTLGDIGNDVTIDGTGNVYTTGNFQGTVDFDPGATVFNLTSAGADDIFISKLDGSGNFVWAKKIGATTSESGASITFESSGNILVTGHFNGTVDFDPGVGVANLTSTGSNDLFVLKLDASGNFVWAKKIGSSSADGGYNIYSDASGNVFTTGYFSGTADFDPGAGVTNLISAGGLDIFILKLDAAGNFVWAKQFGGASTEMGYALMVDASGNVFSTGYFSGTTDFDPGAGVFNMSSSGVSDNDIFVSKLDAAGNFVWAKKLGGVTTGDFGRGISMDSFGNVYTTGYFYGTADFDPSASVFNLITPGGSSDVFISKLDGTGNFVWAKQLGGNTDEMGYDLTHDASNNVYITGCYSGTADFDPGVGVFNMISAGDYDLFVSKLDVSGNFVWSKSMGGNQLDISFGIRTDLSGNIYTTGVFNTTSDFDPNVGVFNLTSAGGTDIFIHKMSQCFAPSAPTSSGQTICSGNTATLTATGTGTLSWYTASTGGSYLGSGSPFTTTTLTTTTTYYVQDSTCTAGVRIPVTVTVNPNPTVSITGSVVICSGNSTTLTAGGASTYVWSTAATTTSITVSPTTTTTYSVVGTDVNGCTGTASISITVNPLPTVGASFTTNPVCVGDPIGWDGTSNGMTFNWTGPGGFTSPLLDPPGIPATLLYGGTYTLTATNAFGCINSTTATLVVNPLPTVTITGTTTICNGTSTTLIAGGASTYVWTSGPSTAAYSVSPTSNTSYTVTGTDANGCVNTATQLITVNPLPTITITGTTTICNGASTTLTAGGASTYVWTSGPSTAAYSVSPTSNTSYTVTGTDANGCLNSATQLVTVNSLPIVVANTSATLVCAGTSVVLTGSGASTYTWDNSVTDGVSFIPPNTTLYTVTGTDVNGCVNTDTITIVVDPCTGINENSNNYAINVFPNPTTGSILVNSEIQVKTIIVTDILGKQILKLNPNSLSTLINLSEYENGIYLIEVNISNQIHKMKIIKN